MIYNGGVKAEDKGCIMIRLDKYLADAGIGTRSEVKKYLKAGRVRVNGTAAGDPAAKIDEASDAVTFDGNAVDRDKFLYYMFYKPEGCVSATKDGLSKTVLEYLKGEPVKNLFPVGRLDKDTTGLLLITNDGQLTHRLLSPKKHIDKVYLAVCDRLLSADEMEHFATGLDIGDDKLTLPAAIEYTGIGEPYAEFTYKVKLFEGRYHQVKRMFEALGTKVLSLKRLSMGPLLLDDTLAPGEYRRLTEEEIGMLRN